MLRTFKKVSMGVSRKYFLSGDYGTLAKTDHREILDKTPRGSNTDDIDFKAMKI